ncbi:hypothetical protein LMG24238_07694 [Paraburkholderia sediminicola]|uniref:Methyl-accepting transducer domain-containing protein n=2 Tax=Paraburkholderia sediminicola TaxID=458836 RepID=A0A6J5CXD1_9BURK|nr:hypothetical protein LMG24238_07694 [Paraburkholderia sediminicola]
MSLQFSSLAVRTRILILIVASLVSIVLVSGLSLSQVRQKVIDGRKQKLHEVVDLGIGIINHQYKLVQAGIISEEAGQKAALDELASLPYKTNEAFFAFKGNGLYILAPEYPEVVGKILWESRDQEMLASATRGGEFIRFSYPKFGEQIPKEKIVYSAMFSPWGWVLSAPVYIDDVDAEFYRNAAQVGGVSVVLLAFLLAIGWRISRSIMISLGGEPAYAAEVAGMLARNDLTGKVKLDSSDRSSLLYALAQTMKSLSATLGNIRASSDSVASAATQIAAGNLDLSARTEQQAASLEQTAATMTQLTETVKQTADNARQAHTLATKASDMADMGNDSVQAMVGAIGQISSSSTKISEITGVIEGIAFQTNILALNAAVEAARAGEQGRGFAVVASEVRSLAQRSAEAAKEIKELISSSVTTIQDGAKQATEVGGTMGQVKQAIKQVSDIVGEIAAASDEQSRGIEQVNQAVGQMDEVTQQNAALVEQAAAAAQSLEEQAIRLQDAISVFKVIDTVQSAAHVVIPQSKPHPPASRIPATGRAESAKSRTAPVTSSAKPASAVDTAKSGWETF